MTAEVTLQSEVASEEAQPQENLVVEAGDEILQPGQPEQPGVDGQVKERTFTQSEVTAMQADADKRYAVVTNAVSQYAMNVEIEKAQAEESRQAAGDQQLVSDGQLTTDEATQRSRGRVTQRQEQMGLQQERAQLQQERAGVDAKLELAGRLGAAQEYGKEFGVDPAVLANDANITDVTSMKNKAREIQLDAREAKAKGSENFDIGMKSGKAVNLDNMSPEEMIRFALNRPVK